MKRRIVQIAAVRLSAQREGEAYVFALDDRGSWWGIFNPDSDDDSDAWDRLPDLPQDDDA